MLYKKDVPDAVASGAVNCARRMGDAGSSFSYFGHFIEPDRVPRLDRARPSSRKQPPAKAAAPEKILHAFNTWAFKREQPDNPDRLLRTIAAAVEDNRPLQFILYWGKGPRNHLDTPDTACLDYLNALVRRAGGAYEHGASVKLIFTDTHAALNGHSPQSMDQYFAAVAAAAEAYGFTGCRLSSLIPIASVGGAARASLVSELPHGAREKLIACAGKWFKGEGSSEEGALRYYQLNLIEKAAVESTFPTAIFVTFNGSGFRFLFPERLPIFYMYSLRRGVSVKPWFLQSEAIGASPMPADQG